MTIATAAAPAVHVELPHLAGHALFEGAVDWRACSAVAVEGAIAGCQGRTPDQGNARRAWARMVATGHVTRDAQGRVTGATLAHCKWALADRGYTDVDFIDYSDTPDLEGALHPLLKAALLAKRPVIGIYTNGQALPDNERGVYGHFTTAVGIDSAAGYLILNGDTQTAIAAQARYRQFPACSEVPTHWATWATLKAAGLAGLIAVHPHAAAPAPTPAPAPAPTPPVATATPPAVAQALAAVEQASQALQAAEAALRAL
jgi:hypothetical protein